MGGYCGLSALLEIGEIGFCELGMVESPFIFYFFSDYLPTYQPIFYIFIYLFIDLSIPLFFFFLFV